ncbi:MAG TPA: hypothetical protein VEN79_12765 [Terriglobia bacterium]|nr:hypothetical protein [Terriglobia bacterium]
MKLKTFVVVLLACSLLLTALVVSFGSGSASTNQPPSSPPATANLTGMWEFHAVSQMVADSGAIIDVNLTPTSTNRYGDAAMGIYSYDKGTLTIGGKCGEQSLTLTVNGDSLTFTLAGTQGISGTGTLSNGVITGTYNGCGDSGTFTAQTSAPFSGTFSGWVGEESAPQMGYVAATFNNNKPSIANLRSNLKVDMKVDATVSGIDNGKLSCVGNQYGESFNCDGIFEGKQVHALGWYDMGGLLVPAGDFIVFSFGQQGTGISGDLGPGGSNLASRTIISKQIIDRKVPKTSR